MKELLQEIPRRRQIWVVDVYWSVEKNFLTEFAVAVNDRDEIVVADQLDHRVQVFDSNGTFLRSFGHKGENAGEFKYPFGIAINKDRNIFCSRQ